MTVTLGATSIGAVYLGATPVDAVYLGADLVWSATPPTPSGSWHDFPWKYSWLADDLPNGNVSSWVDGQASVALTQATGSKQPIRAATTGANSQPAITFDGVNDYLQNASVNVATPDTIIVIGRLATLGTYTFLFDGITGRQFVGVDSAADGRWRLYGGLGRGQYGGTADTAAHVFVCQYGTSGSLDVDGTTLTSGDTGAAGLQGLNIGINFNGNYIANSVISAVGIVSGDATTYPEWPALQSLILSKWGSTA